MVAPSSASWSSSTGARGLVAGTGGRPGLGTTRGRLRAGLEDVQKVLTERRWVGWGTLQDRRCPDFTMPMTDSEGHYT